MTTASADRNLLLGILALQNNFISRDSLLAAFAAWIADKSVDLGNQLLVGGKVTASQVALLEALVEELLKQNNGSPGKCLKQLSSISAARQELEQLGDPDLQASLRRLPSPGDGDLRSSPTLQPPALGAPSDVGARFRILRPHAEGGLGKVWVARDEELNREVALKEIKLDFAADSESRLRFLREAEITGGLEHPSVVPVYGLGQHPDGRPFYAMRFIQGDSLKDAIEFFHNSRFHSDSARNLHVRKMLQRFIDVCEAIAYAHSRGVLHRDLKPGNIMLGKYGETLVVDWGLARAGTKPEGESTDLSDALDRECVLSPRSGDGSTTLPGEAMGTPAYMPPEQAAGRPDLLGPAADVYSLGGTLYSILTGKPPIEGLDTAEVLKNVREGRIVPPRHHDRSIPTALEAICLKALAREPAQRYLSARLLADDVEQYLADEPVTALPESVARRAGRWLRKHRAAALSAAAALLLISIVSVAFAVVVTGQNAIIARQKEDALKLAVRNADLAKKEAMARKEADDRRRDAELARLAADKAKGEAEQARDQAKAVSDYLVAAMRSPDPERDGRKVTVAEVLQRAADELMDKSELGLAQGAVLNAIGQSMLGLGMYAEAIPVTEQARRIRQAELGADHADTLISMNNLAAAYQSAGRFDDAARLYEQTLKLMQAKLGADHPAALTALSNLALAHHAAGRVATAMPLLEEARRLRKVTLGPDHVDSLVSLNNLAYAYESEGRLRQALPLYEETRDRLTATLGKSHPLTLKAMNNLANAYRETGRLNEAIALLEETLALEKEKLGDDHNSTLVTLGNLAQAYEAAGRLRDATALNKLAFDLRKTKLGLEHPDTLTSMNNLASIYSATGRLKEAIPLYEQVLENRARVLGLKHRHTILSMNNLAHAYHSAGRVAEAFPLYQETLDLMKDALGVDHPDTLVTMNNMAAAWQAAGRSDQAIPLLEQAVRLLKSSRGGSHADTLTALNNLAMAYHAAKRHDQALPIFQETFKLRQEALGEDHPATLGSMNDLAFALAEAERFEEALPLYEKTVELREDKLGADHSDTLISMSNLAHAYEAAGRAVAALPVLEECFDRLQAREPLNLADEALQLSVLNKLVKVCEGLGQVDQAAQWRAELEKRQ